MLVLLDIAHTHGVSPVSLASIVRASGKKSLDMAAAECLLEFYTPGESDDDEGEQEDDEETQSESISKRQRARKFIDDEAYGDDE